jgi:hypothetical protein
MFCSYLIIFSKKRDPESPETYQYTRPAQHMESRYHLVSVRAARTKEGDVSDADDTDMLDGDSIVPGQFEAPIPILSRNLRFYHG